jgi:hypothetical protein
MAVQHGGVVSDNQHFFDTLCGKTQCNNYFYHNLAKKIGYFTLQFLGFDHGIGHLVQ